MMIIAKMVLAFYFERIKPSWYAAARNGDAVGHRRASDWCRRSATSVHASARASRLLVVKAAVKT